MLVKKSRYKDAGSFEPAEDGSEVFAGLRSRTIREATGVVEHEVHGMLVAPREPAAIARALARLDEDRALLRRLAEAARARVVAHYGMARLEADFERLYGSLCGVGRS